MRAAVGIDIGSTCAKTAVLDGEQNLVTSFVMPTGWSSVDTAEAIRRRLAEEGFDTAALPCVATGYGRVAVPYADKTVTEITCHGLGALRLFGEPDCAVVDIGGQDTKIIRLSGGAVADFLMNDKCSAGTGRFLEVMASTLGIGPDELCALSGRGGGTSISSLCTVFAESEVISLIAQNKEIADIAHGLCNAIAGKAYSLMKRVGLEETFMMTGGVALNPGVVKAIEERTGSRFFISDQPEIAGALGAALFALEKYTVR